MSSTYQLELRQRLNVLQNRYDLVRLGPSGEVPLGYAEQKRFSLKEKVTVWAGTSKDAPLFTIGARNVFELAATYDVQDAAGSSLAVLKKSAAASLLRSTYTVDLPDGRHLTLQERGAVKAALRRVAPHVVGVPWPFPIQFDAVDPSGQVLVSVERMRRLRDRYLVTVDASVDERVAGALAVAVDAFMDR